MSFIRKNIQFVFISISLVLLVGLLLYWCSSEYERSKANLRNDVSFNYASAIRDFEDSLMHSVFFYRMEDPSAMHKMISARITQKDSTKQTLRVFHRSIDNQAVVERRDGPDPGRKLEDRPFIGSLSMLLHVQNADTVRLDSSMLYAVHDEVIGTMQDQFERHVAEYQWPFDFEIIQKDSMHETIPGELLSRPYFDFLSRSEYVVKIRNYKSYLLSSITPQIIYSISLLGLTLLSFVLMYRALKKQRNLTRYKNDLISNITHELKTPITTVGVALEALEGFTVGDDVGKREEYLAISKQEMNRLAILVDKVLQNTSNDTQTLEMNMEWFNLKDCIDEIMGAMKLLFQKNGARVTVEVSHQEIPVFGDRFHLSNVLYNLLDNAMKYSNPDPVIHLALQSNSSSIAIVIADNGPGIDKRFHKRIFDRFFRVPTNNIHDVKGHGLGLSYAKRIVQSHHGAIEVTSSKPSGSTFTVFLPKLDEDD